MSLFFLLLLIDGPAPKTSLSGLKPIFHLTEEHPVLGEHQLGYPFDALVHEGKIYVADMYANIMVFEPDALIRVFGEQGQGPKELAHPPVALELNDDQLHVTEMYGWHFGVFGLDGEMVDKHPLSRNWAKTGSRLFQSLNWREAKAAGFRYLHESTGCPVSLIDAYSHADYHLAGAIVIEMTNRLLVVRRSGFVELYGKDCRLEDVFPLPLEPFKRPMIEDVLGTELSKVVASRQGMIAYQYGVPVISAAHENEERLWFLVSREELENQLRKPEETWLFSVDLASGRVLFKTKLKTPAEKVRISEGHLILISTEYAEITAWSLAQMHSLIQ